MLAERPWGWPKGRGVGRVKPPGLLRTSPAGGGLFLSCAGPSLRVWPPPQASRILRVLSLFQAPECYPAPSMSWQLSQLFSSGFSANWPFSHCVSWFKCPREESDGPLIFLGQATGQATGRLMISHLGCASPGVWPWGTTVGRGGWSDTVQIQHRKGQPWCQTSPLCPVAKPAENAVVPLMGPLTPGLMGEGGGPSPQTFLFCPLSRARVGRGTAHHATGWEKTK